jgi:hypothetical protein
MHCRCIIAYASISTDTVEEPVRVHFNVTGHENVLFQHMVHVTIMDSHVRTAITKWQAESG